MQNVREQKYTIKKIYIKENTECVTHFPCIIFINSKYHRGCTCNFNGERIDGWLHRGL